MLILSPIDPAFSRFFSPFPPAAEAFLSEKAQEFRVKRGETDSPACSPSKFADF